MAWFCTWEIAVDYLFWFLGWCTLSIVTFGRMPVGGPFDKEKNANGNVIITDIVGFITFLALGFLTPGFEFLLELI